MLAKEKRSDNFRCFSPFSGRLLKIYGDRNCLFKAVAVAEDEELIACDRSPSRMPLNRLMAEIEDSQKTRQQDYRKRIVRSIRAVPKI